MPVVLHTKAGITGLSFGLAAEEGNLITSKVSSSRKIKKKDLRGRQAGYKCIASFGETVDVSIEGAVDGSGTTGFTLGAASAYNNDPFSLGITLYVESIAISEKNDDFTRATIKLVGNANMG